MLSAGTRETIKKPHYCVLFFTVRLRRPFIRTCRGGLCRNANRCGGAWRWREKIRVHALVRWRFHQLLRGKVSLFVLVLVLHAVPQRAMDVGISPHHRLMLGDRIVASSSIECVPPNSIIVVFYFIFNSRIVFLSVTSVCVRPCGRCQRFVFRLYSVCSHLVASASSTRHVCATFSRRMDRAVSIIQYVYHHQCFSVAQQALASCSGRQW
jgi:hypothetical protein